jgi:hypothetical protein
MPSKHAIKTAAYMRPKQEPVTFARCNGVRRQGFILDQIIVVDGRARSVMMVVGETDKLGRLLE